VLKGYYTNISGKGVENMFSKDCGHEHIHPPSI